MAKCDEGVTVGSRSHFFHLQSALAPNSVSQRSVFLCTSNEIYDLSPFFFSFFLLILLFLFPLSLFFLLRNFVSLISLCGLKVKLFSHEHFYLLLYLK